MTKLTYQEFLDHLKKLAQDNDISVIAFATGNGSNNAGMLVKHTTGAHMCDFILELFSEYPEAKQIVMGHLLLQDLKPFEVEGNA